MRVFFTGIECDSYGLFVIFNQLSVTTDERRDRVALVWCERPVPPCNMLPVLFSRRPMLNQLFARPRMLASRQTTVVLFVYRAEELELRS